VYQLKRVYDFDEKDLPAVLADRLWPRGIAKVRLKGVLWLKEVAPSTVLRQWFHQDPEQRYPEFCQRYRIELRAPELQTDLQQLRQLYAQNNRLTLLPAAKEIDRCHLPVLESVLRSVIDNPQQNNL
jgi:uncharacterized protein YeaO (DUF488 family)